MNLFFIGTSTWQIKRNEAQQILVAPQCRLLNISHEKHRQILPVHFRENNFPNVYCMKTVTWPNDRSPCSNTESFHSCNNQSIVTGKIAILHCNIPGFNIVYVYLIFVSLPPVQFYSLLEIRERRQLCALCSVESRLFLVTGAHEVYQNVDAYFILK